MITAVVEYDASADAYAQSYFKFADLQAADKWARAIFKDGCLAIGNQNLPERKRRGIDWQYIPVARIVSIKLSEDK